MSLPDGQINGDVAGQCKLASVGDFVRVRKQGAQNHGHSLLLVAHTRPEDHGRCVGSAARQFALGRRELTNTLVLSAAVK